MGSSDCEELRSGQKLQKSHFEAAAYANFATPAKRLDECRTFDIDGRTNLSCQSVVHKRIPTIFSIAALALICAGGALSQVSTGIKVIPETDCTSLRLGDGIPASAIGEPVFSVTLGAPRWNAATSDIPAHCGIDGSMAPVDRGPTARPHIRGIAVAGWIRPIRTRAPHPKTWIDHSIPFRRTR